MDLTKYYPDIAAKYPAYVTQRELCEICRICPKTAYNLEQQGEIPYTIEQNHLIRSHKIKLTDILAYCAAPADPGRNPGGPAALRSTLRCGNGDAGQAGQVDLCPVLPGHDRQGNCPGGKC